MRLDKAYRDQIAEAALVDLRRALKYSRLHSAKATKAEALYGQGNGHLISGIVREHFPEPVKTRLRYYARSVGELMERSYQRWRTAGRRRHTWLRAKDAAVARYGRGFYG